MLNSAEHEILNACKYKNIKKFSIFAGSDRPRMLFFLTFMSRKNSCSAELSMKKSFITSGPRYLSFKTVILLEIHFSQVFI